MNTENHKDLIIIGAGPIGLACGLEAKKAGLNYLIIEKGCLVNSLFNYPVTMTFFSTSDKLEIGNVPFISHNPKPTRGESLEYYRRVQSSQGLNVNLYEEVKSMQAEVCNEGTKYRIDTSKKTYTTKAVIVATGFYDIPKKMSVVGENLPKVKHYYDDPHLYAGQKVIVVGAQNSAVDVALETYRKGAEVTMVVRGPEIGKRVKYWVRPDIENRIKEGAIKAIFNASVKEVREQEVDISTPKKTITIENDFVLAMTGYQPNFQLLTSIGIEIEEGPKRRPIHNSETMETNLPNVYLAGVVCGGMETSKWFIENSRKHAQIILEQIVGKVEA